MPGGRIPEFEHSAQPVIPVRQFTLRLVQSGIIVLAPVAHRILHKFHVEGRDH